MVCLVLFKMGIFPLGEGADRRLVFGLLGVNNFYQAAEHIIGLGLDVADDGLVGGVFGENFGQRLVNLGEGVGKFHPGDQLL